MEHQSYRFIDWYGPSSWRDANNGWGIFELQLSWSKSIKFVLKSISLFDRSHLLRLCIRVIHDLFQCLPRVKVTQNPDVSRIFSRTQVHQDLWLCPITKFIYFREIRSPHKQGSIFSPPLISPSFHNFSFYTFYGLIHTLELAASLKLYQGLSLCYRE